MKDNGGSGRSAPAWFVFLIVRQNSQYFFLFQKRFVLFYSQKPIDIVGDVCYNTNIPDKHTKGAVGNDA